MVHLMVSRMVLNLRSLDGFPDETTLGNIDGVELGINDGNRYGSNYW